MLVGIWPYGNANRIRKTFKKWAECTANETNGERQRRGNASEEKKNIEQQAALRIKEKLKTRKVTTTKTRLHEPLFMPLMNANKLKWLEKETKTYTLYKNTRKTLYERSR